MGMWAQGEKNESPAAIRRRMKIRRDRRHPVKNVRLGKTNETAFLKAIDRAIGEEKRRGNQLQSLRTWRTHLNIAALGFDGLWHTWYPNQAPPKLEVDLLCVFPGLESHEVQRRRRTIKALLKIP